MSNESKPAGRQQRPHEKPVSGTVKDPNPQSIPEALFPNDRELIHPKWWERLLLFFMMPNTARDITDCIVTTVTFKRMFGKTYVMAIEQDVLPLSVPDSFRGAPRCCVCGGAATSGISKNPYFAEAHHCQLHGDEARRRLELGKLSQGLDRFGRSGRVDINDFRRGIRGD